jgi:hypothetical protein
MEPIGFPETSLKNYHSTLRNIPEERRYHLQGDGSLKSRLEISCLGLFMPHSLSVKSSGVLVLLWKISSN